MLASTFRGRAIVCQHLSTDFRAATNIVSIEYSAASKSNGAAATGSGAPA